MKQYFTQILGDERGGKEFYIIGKRPTLKVGDRCVFHHKGFFVADALVVREPLPTIDPARPEQCVMRIDDVEWYDIPVAMSDLQEKHLTIHGRSMSTRGGSKLTDGELGDIRRRSRGEGAY